MAEVAKPKGKVDQGQLIPGLQQVKNHIKKADYLSSPFSVLSEVGV